MLMRVDTMLCAACSASVSCRRHSPSTDPYGQSPFPFPFTYLIQSAFGLAKERQNGWTGRDEIGGHQTLFRWKRLH
ncbi:hypothetical protein CORC01_12298 [Colletotrichum orchidophilum]|uniref:Uncharacterized protein n=1 Tax=Colletotrichum orchidophilum TaxID=1209926 RepID=A0A1G4ATF2_9PEZI|nr:uncharacterized protein CORC01_12298 [Colletotrichum orchidophilum]OHE92437.1 hypothetical protein CORC01_12298 [Colletotrichum orchidophilum]